MPHWRNRKRRLRLQRHIRRHEPHCKTAKRPYERRSNGRKKIHFSTWITNKHSILRTLHFTARKRCYYDFFIILRTSNITITHKCCEWLVYMLHMIFMFASKHAYKMFIYKLFWPKCAFGKISSTMYFEWWASEVNVPSNVFKSSKTSCMYTSNDELRSCM